MQLDNEKLNELAERVIRGIAELAFVAPEIREGICGISQSAATIIIGSNGQTIKKDVLTSREEEWLIRECEKKSSIVHKTICSLILSYLKGISPLSWTLFLALIISRATDGIVRIPYLISGLR